MLKFGRSLQLCLVETTPSSSAPCFLLHLGAQPDYFSQPCITQVPMWLSPGQTEEGESSGDYLQALVCKHSSAVLCLLFSHPLAGWGKYPEPRGGQSEGVWVHESFPLKMIPGPWISLFYAKAMISKEEWQTHSLVFSKTHSRKVPFSGTTSVKIFRWTWTLGNSRICPSPLFPITRLVCSLLAQLKLGAGSRGQAEGPQTRLFLRHPASLQHLQFLSVTQFQESPAASFITFSMDCSHRNVSPHMTKMGCV